MSLSIYFTSLTLLLFACIVNIYAVNCPGQCSCRWELDSLIVDCSNRGLVDYPFIEDGLPVEHLDLSYNYFQTFPSQYSSITSLSYLDLTSNDIAELPVDALVGFESLRVLILANNSISSWSDLNPNLSFQHAYSLQKLSLSGNFLARFSDNAGAPLLVSDVLTELDLSHCGITQVDNVLSGMPSLEKLVLSGNKLTALISLPSLRLRSLDVSNCSLTWINTSLMDSLPSLNVLNLSWNPGVILGSKPGEIIQWENLRQIDMSFCNVDSLEFSGMPSLVVVLLKSNMIHSISDSMFANNSLVELLDLSKNDIRHIDPSAFSNLRRLTALDLSYNEIFRVDKNQFRNNDALVTINLSHNIFNEFARFISNSLRTINLSWCEILQIDPNVFSGFKTLVNLDLSNNLITQFPNYMRSETLKKLDLSMCRLSIVRNSTFSGFPELASLNLAGNRFTNPFLPEYFKSNTFLNQIWLGDNLWRCDCHDGAFMAFYDFLTIKPQKLKDMSNVKCSSPTAYYGKTWEGACLTVWYPATNDRAAKKVWTILMILFLTLGAVLLVISCVKKFVRGKIRQRNRQEQRENERELAEIRRQNSYILSQEAQQNAPTTFESMLPSYEDALLMPKLHRVSKSMMDLTPNRKSKPRSKSDIETAGVPIEEEECVLDHHRFRSEEMLSNREKERTAFMGAFRRTGKIEHNSSGTRRFSIEDSRFPAAFMRSQNLQSAEKIANFQGYDYSPYSKRRPRPQDIPVFKRASIRDSVEFLTDSEYNSKPGSPFAQRKPLPDTTASSLSLHSNRGKVPADKSFKTIEEHFGRDEIDQKLRASSSSSDFQIMRSSDADLASIADSDSSKRASPVIVVHTPIRESRF